MGKPHANKPQGGAVEGAQKQLNDLKAFIIEKKLVTIPGTEEPRLAKAPPYQSSNLAYIDIPGAYEKGLPSIYYIASPDPSGLKLSGKAYVPGVANLRFLSVHEVWPGHFLQGLHHHPHRVVEWRRAGVSGFAGLCQKTLWRSAHDGNQISRLVNIYFNRESAKPVEKVISQAK
ncbi:MAG: DUF885 family protein [Acidobacteria bacterium]|nr:DUF885 family protein [Acidobacteriota bacterium]